MKNTFYTKVAGSSNYQKAIKKCRKNQQCQFHHEPNNEYDMNAIKVMVGKRHIGYLNAELAREVCAESRKGARYSAVIKDITGGTRDKPTRGVNLEITKFEKGFKKKKGCSCGLMFLLLILGFIGLIYAITALAPSS